MPWTYTDDYYKAYTRDTWNESAPHYGPVLQNSEKYSPALLEAAGIQPGHDVLDVGTGPGEPATSLARSVGPGGSVLGIDLAEEMIAVARRSADDAGATNLEFRVMDAEELDLPTASFDRVVCRFGLQIVTDPEACIAEAYRVLRPGGRFAAAVWASPGDRCAAMHVLVGPMMERAEPDETGYLPSPYEMGGPGELATLFRAAGFGDLQETTTVHDWTFASEDAYFEAALRGTPLGHSLAEEDPDVQEAILREAHRNLQRYVEPDGAVRAPCEAVIVAGNKPS